MNRKDGFIYSGMTSSSSDRASVREEEKVKKEKDQREIEPFAPAIFDLIQKEKDSMGLILAGLIDSTQSSAEVQAHIEAVKLHRDWVIRFETQVKKKLRVGKASKVVQGESFEEIIAEGKKNVRR